MFLLEAQPLPIWKCNKNEPQVIQNAEAYSEPCQTCKRKLFAKIVDGVPKKLPIEVTPPKLYDKGQPLVLKKQLKNR